MIVILLILIMIITILIINIIIIVFIQINIIIIIIINMIVMIIIINNHIMPRASWSQMRKATAARKLTFSALLSIYLSIYIISQSI